jgi:hypothetical protein
MSLLAGCQCRVPSITISIETNIDHFASWSIIARQTLTASNFGNYVRKVQVEAEKVLKVGIELTIGQLGCLHSGK